VGDFRTEYARRYGEGALMAGAVVELVSVRAIGVGRTVKPDLAPSPAGHEVNGATARSGTRDVRLARGAAPVAVDVHAGASLGPGDRIAGPALVDGSDTTVWVPPGGQARVDSRNNLVLEVES
jgi:N-methylhydantoinase A